MDTTITTLDGWNLGGQPRGKVSSGRFPTEDSDLQRRILPFYSTALIIAKNIEITGNWSEADERKFSRSLSTSASVGVGCFRLKGNYSSSISGGSFNSEKDDATYKVPGAQVIGVINRVVPLSPPDDGR